MPDTPLDPGMLPEGWRKLDETHWERDVKEGMVRVTSEVGDGGIVNFWLETFDGDDNLAGPYGSAEAWLDVRSAMREGDRVAALDWNASPNYWERLR